MTQEEYEKVCSIIDENIKTDWVSMNYQRKSIDMQGVTQIKEELKELVKE